MKNWTPIGKMPKPPENGKLFLKPKCDTEMDDNDPADRSEGFESVQAQWLRSMPEWKINDALAKLNQIIMEIANYVVWK